MHINKDYVHNHSLYNIILVYVHIDKVLGGALSSISLSIERAPPLRNSPHTGFSFLD